MISGCMLSCRTPSWSPRRCRGKLYKRNSDLVEKVDIEVIDIGNIIAAEELPSKDMDKVGNSNIAWLEKHCMVSRFDSD